MDDLIRRQDAIDAIVTWTVEDRPDLEMPTDLVDRVTALPSAQPEIIRCKDCKEYQTDWKPSSYPKHFCATMDSMMPEDGFCSYAERR